MRASEPDGGDPSQDLNPDPTRQVTHETDGWGGLLPQFLAGSSTQLVYYRPVDDNGADEGYDYTINIDWNGPTRASPSRPKERSTA